MEPFAHAFSKELVFALDVCERAGAVALQYFKQGVQSVMKDDGSPVTVADKEVEALIRQAVLSSFPGDDILGEEEGEQKGAASDKGKRKRSTRRWIIDPIDGTYGFARGVPIFSTLLALEQDGEIVLGVVHNPARGETYWAETTKGAFKNGERIGVSEITKLSESQFNFGGPNRILEHGLWDGFTRLIAGTYRQRGLGDYLSFAGVFEGTAEIQLEVGLKPWDLAPMKILASEAGGKFSDLAGGQSIYQGSCLITNGHVHEAALKLLTDS